MQWKSNKFLNLARFRPVRRFQLKSDREVIEKWSVQTYKKWSVNVCDYIVRVYRWLYLIPTTFQSLFDHFRDKLKSDNRAGCLLARGPTIGFFCLLCNVKIGVDTKNNLVISTGTLKCAKSWIWDHAFICYIAVVTWLQHWLLQLTLLLQLTY